MKLKLSIYIFLLVVTTNEVRCQKQFQLKDKLTSLDYITAFKDTLIILSEKSNNGFFKMHCNSMLAVFNSKVNYTSADSTFLLATYNAFNNQADTSNAKELSSYLKRQRPFILSWISPTDGAVSFSRLKVPKDWNPQNEYPVYIQLHGLTSSADNPIEYVTKPFRDNPSSTFSFEDGYMLAPWGRGNYWYQGISETDIWECLAALEEIVKTDPSRKYISGHSMGGYGAWSIAVKSPGTWAALGVHAGALWYDNNDLVNSENANKLKDLPTYFVCGTNDGLLNINQTAYNLLEDAGNENIEFVTFTGGHEYLEENVENMFLWMREFVNEDATGVNENIELSQTEPQLRIYPNPLKTFSKVLYTISEISHINITIYDLFGRKVKILVDDTKMPASYEVLLDASDLPNGFYIVNLNSGKLSIEKKLFVNR
jgi:predicted esterase